MLYFSDRPAPPSKLNATERKKIERFKKELGDDSLYWSNDIVQFRTDFRHHLLAVMNEILTGAKRRRKTRKPQK